MRTSTFIALTLIVAFGCTAPVGTAGPSGSAVASGEPTPATTPLPSASSPAPSTSARASVEPSVPAPSAAVSPSPTAPPDLARVAVKVRDKIRVEFELQRNPLPAGERSWVKVRVKNEGRTDVTWFHDGCSEPVSVRGVSEVAWPMGEERPGQAGKFKTYALGGYFAAAPDPHGVLAFVEERFLHSGPPGCADIGITDTIKPGETVRRTRWWSGFTDPHRALPPAGPATIRGFAGYYWRGKEPEDITDHAIELELDAWIVSDAAAERLSPAQAIDAALADPTFVDYLQTQAIADGRAEIAWYDADRDLWEIGVMPWYETKPPRIHGVLVDAVTGKILGPLDRPWDQDVDPFP
jgi:hypothetical protein